MFDIYAYFSFNIELFLMMNRKKFLMIQTGFIGDTILSLSLPAVLKHFIPDSFVSVMVEATSQTLYDENPHVDEMIPFYKRKGKLREINNIFSIFKHIKQQNFDKVLIFNTLSYSTMLFAYLANIPIRIGYTHSVLSHLLTVPVPMDRNLHMIDRYLQLISAMGFDVNSLGKERYTINIKQSFDHFQSFSEKHHLKQYRHIIGISPGSRWATKRWNPKKFAELASQFIVQYSAKILFFGSKDDASIMKEILYYSKDKAEHIVDLCGKTTLHNLYYLIHRCTLLISNDSCAMHLGSVANIPMVSIWGATVPSLGFAPLSSHSSIIERELKCRPCGKHTHGGNQCPLGHFKCMNDISVYHVFKVCEKYLK